MIDSSSPCPLCENCAKMTRARSSLPTSQPHKTFLHRPRRIYNSTIPYLEGQGDLVSRLTMRINRVTIWVIGVINPTY